MTDAPLLNGQDIGQAAKATRAVLDRLLEQVATTFEQWVALNLVATTPGRADRAAVIERLVIGLPAERSVALDVIDQLHQHGLVTGSDELTLTPAGAAAYGRIRDGIATITDRLYGDLPREDLATAHRVLAAVTAKADAEIAGN